MTLEQQAKKAWEKIKSNLEDRSFHFSNIDDETMAELDAEQTEVIAAAFRPVREPARR